MDYDPLRPVIVRFAMCQTRSCANVTILDDVINEPVESFFIFLDEASDVRITLNPVDGEILIEDDDSRLLSKTTSDILSLANSSTHRCWLRTARVHYIRD